MGTHAFRYGQDAEETDRAASGFVSDDVVTREPWAPHLTVRADEYLEE